MQRILMFGLPKDANEAAHIRPLAWKVLLQLHLVPSARSDLPPSPAEADDEQTQPASSAAVHPLLSAGTYYSLISREPSLMFSKIRNDSFRTLATDHHFRTKVGEDRLVRCLEAFVWRQLGQLSRVTYFVWSCQRLTYRVIEGLRLGCPSDGRAAPPATVNRPWHALRPR